MSASDADAGLPRCVPSLAFFARKDFGQTMHGVLFVVMELSHAYSISACSASGTRTTVKQFRPKAYDAGPTASSVAIIGLRRINDLGQVRYRFQSDPADFKEKKKTV